MEKRRSFDELMNAVKNGRALSPEAVARTVEQFSETPIGALFSGRNREEWLPDLLKLNPVYNSETDYIHFLYGDLIVFGKKNLHRVEMLFTLAAIGYLDPVSRHRVVDRLPDTSGKAASETENAKDDPKTQVHRADSEELRREMKMDELYHKNVLPFLRLTIRDYTEYLAGCDPDFPKVYQRFFARDVELWEKENGTTPTIGDVLAQAIQALSCFADVKELVRDEEMENCPLWKETPERSFRRKNIQGTYWPPEDEEGILDAEWVYLLMYVGPLLSYTARLEKADRKKQSQ